MLDLVSKNKNSHCKTHHFSSLPVPPLLIVVSPLYSRLILVVAWKQRGKIECKKGLLSGTWKQEGETEKCKFLRSGENKPAANQQSTVDQPDGLGGSGGLSKGA